MNGPIGKVQTGDMLIIDAEAGVLDIELDEQTWQSRPVAQPEHQAETQLVLAGIIWCVPCGSSALLNMAHLCLVHLLAKSHGVKMEDKRNYKVMSKIEDVVKLGPVIPVLAFDSAEQGEHVSRALHAGM